MLNNYPKSWNDISVSQFQEFFQLKNDDFDLEDEFNAHLLSILTDTSLDEINDLPYEDFNKLLKDIEFVFKLPNKPIISSIEVAETKLYYIQDFNQITIGELIDLENLFQQSYIKNIQNILSILYRQKDIKNSPLYLDTFEPYGDWIFHRAPLFNDVKISDVYGVIPAYIKWREEFFDRYQGLFNDREVENEDEEQPINEGIIGKSERLKAEAKEKSIKKWAWDMLLFRLAKSDPTKLEEATRMPLLQAFNILSMAKELGLE